MTLTQLAQKYDIDHDKAVAFLRDWLDAQPVLWYRSQGYQLFENDYSIPLIARPELGDL